MDIVEDKDREKDAWVCYLELVLAAWWGRRPITKGCEVSGENNRPQNKPVSLKKRNNATLRDLRNILMQCDPRLDWI